MSQNDVAGTDVVDGGDERVLICVAGDRDRALLADRLSDRYTVLEGDPAEVEEVDLCLVDGASYRGVASGLADLKRTAEAYLPVLLLVEDRDGSGAPEWLEETVGGTADDVLVVPSPPHELDARVEALMRTRRQSLELSLYRRAMDEAAIGISITDPSRPDNPLVYVNDGFCRLTGYDREDVLGRNCRFLQGPDTDEATLDRLRAAIDAEEPVTVELRNYRADGEPFWNRLTIAPVRDARGEVTHFLGFQADVTDRVDRERELHRERERFEALARTATDAIIVIDPDNTVRYANPAVERVFGHPPDAVEGDSLSTLVPAPFDDQHEAGFQRYLETGERTIDWNLVRFTGRHADGHDVPLEVSLAEFEGPDGPLFAGIVRDVTDRERLQTELETERELLEGVFETSPVGILVVDADGDIVRANAAAEAELGLERSEIASRTYDDPEWEAVDLDGDPIAEADLPAGRVLRTGEPVEDYRHGIRIDGETRWIEVNSAPMRDADGEVVAVVNAIEDITDRLAYERDLERASRILETMDDAVWAIDDTQEISFVNATVGEYLPFDTAEIVGAPLENFRYLFETDAEYDRYLTAVEALLDGRRAEATIDARLSMSGETMVSNLRLAAIPGEDEIKGVVVVASDITDRVDLEAELRSERQLLERIFDTSPAGILVVDADGDITRANPAAEAELGLEQSEIASRTYDDPEWEAVDAAGDPVPSEDLPVARVLRTGEPVEDYRHGIRVDGETRWLSINAPPLTDADGIVEAVVTGVTDITDHLERTRDLERYEAIVQTTSDPIYVLDPEGHFVRVNDAMVEASGYGREELLGEHVSLVADEETVAIAEDHIVSLLRGEGDTAEFEGSMEFKDGRRREFAASIAVLRADDGEFTGSVVVAHDITDLHRSQRRLSVLDRILRHNLRNRMNVVVGHAQELADHADADVAALGDTIADSARNLLELSESARRFEAIVTGGADPTTPMDVTEVIEDVVAQAREDYPAADLTLDQPETARILGHRTFRLAIDECIDNAIKHNDSDPPCVDVTVRTTDEGIEIRVADDGPGIPDLEKRALAAGSESPLEHMQGIGLWLIRWTVETVGGDLDITDNEPHGTILTITVPESDA